MITHTMLLMLGRKISSLPDVKALEMQTYIMAAVVAIAFLGLAALISSNIAFEGGALPTDPRKRRIWFWSLVATALSSHFLYNTFIVAPMIASRWQGRFMKTLTYSSIALVLTYVLLGFILSRMFATGKLGTWFSTGRR
jgi:hypothetical protein